MSSLKAYVRPYIFCVYAAGVAALASSFVLGVRPPLVPLLVAAAAAVLFGLLCCAWRKWR